MAGFSKMKYIKVENCFACPSLKERETENQNCEILTMYFGKKIKILDPLKIHNDCRLPDLKK